MHMSTNGKLVKYPWNSFKYWWTGFSIAEKFWKGVNKELVIGL